MRGRSVHLDIARSTVTVAAILSIAFGATAHAETAANSTPPRAGSCWDGAISQRDMTDCAMNDFRAADEKLNKSV